MKRKVVLAALCAAAFAVASGTPGGGQPPGLLGYEGQPGNQGG